MNFAKTALTDMLVLAADSTVFLAAGERMEVFSGRHLVRIWRSFYRTRIGS